MPELLLAYEKPVLLTYDRVPRACSSCSSDLPTLFEVGKYSGFAVAPPLRGAIVCYTCAARYELSYLRAHGNSGNMPLFYDGDRVLNTTGFLQFPVVSAKKNSSGATRVSVSGPFGLLWCGDVSSAGGTPRITLRWTWMMSNIRCKHLYRVDYPVESPSPHWLQKKKCVIKHVLGRWIYPHVVYAPITNRDRERWKSLA